ncbi:MAG TPA: biotin/lipoyl-containing protein [Ktedonobacteraceae bacterium]|nr:biotin/lipoyl-containing protein [Ktedonobacteraceae bacterium]
MKTDERKMSWLERVEELINVLEGSSIGELELSEAGTEIIIRRRPGMVMVNAPTQQGVVAQGRQGGVTVAPVGGGRVVKEDHSIAIVAPLTGVYYSAPSPTLPPFVSPGDMVYAGQVVALIEAMKVFNEIQSEVAGRVVALVGPSGEVVQKGDALIRVEPV